MADDKTEPEKDNPKPDANWQFTDNDQAAVEVDAGSPTAATEAPTQAGNQKSVIWTASEYANHEKGTGWFIGLGAGGLVIGGLIYLITKDYLATFLIMAMVIIFGVFAARKPQDLEYGIDSHGLQIGPKNYPYGRFKSFAIIDEGGLFSIMLLPLKRFMPPISIYYDSKDEKNIVDVLSSYLPMEQRSHDLTDQLMRKIRF